MTLYKIGKLQSSIIAVKTGSLGPINLKRAEQIKIDKGLTLLGQKYDSATYTQAEKPKFLDWCGFALGLYSKKKLPENRASFLQKMPYLLQFLILSHDP